MNKREVMIAVGAAMLAVTVAKAGGPPPPPPPVLAPLTQIRPWEAFCIDASKAGVEQTWANDDLDKEVGWNRVIRHYAAQGYEPFQLLTTASDSKRGVAIISAVCFKRPGG